MVTAAEEEDDDMVIAALASASMAAANFTLGFTVCAGGNELGIVLLRPVDFIKPVVVVETGVGLVFARFSGGCKN